MKKNIFIVLLTFLPLSAHAEIFRCVLNGTTTFQDSPCEGVPSERVNTNNLNIVPFPQIHSQPPITQPTTPQRPQQRANTPSRYQSTIDRRNAEVKARNRGVVIPGMTERQAISILGTPSSISTHTYDGNVCRNLYWNGTNRFQRGRHSVRICNGEVSSYSGN
ncbi:DUF4124 domain-containing protein [Vreelandella nigrificans]|uniref:DUF4124 domain-containing protein n=1 Tax=Vreelandella nigrificans TaxID=2042704 RepID=A0A2A4HQ69_9GAMM|nr:hypothetical protein CPA45_04210 [Halomonas nigrificans]